MDTMRPDNGTGTVPGRSLGPSRAKLRTAAWLSVMAMTQALPSAAAADISKDQAIAIALREARCRMPQDCEIRGGLQDGKWIFVVWFVKGRNPEGSPQFAPGGWVGLTVDAQGGL